MPFDSEGYEPTDPDYLTLREARRLLTQGWCKGDYTRTLYEPNADGERQPQNFFCAMGALWYATAPGGCGSMHQARRLARDYLAPELGFSDTSLQDAESLVVVFNDNGARTREQVVGLFDDALATLRERILANG